jgi:hypothetical protein
MRGAIPPFHMYALMACTGSTLSFMVVYAYAERNMTAMSKRLKMSLSQSNKCCGIYVIIRVCMVEEMHIGI